jgi:large subunit ribosomal protein L22
MALEKKQRDPNAKKAPGKDEAPKKDAPKKAAAKTDSKKAAPKKSAAKKQDKKETAKKDAKKGDKRSKKAAGKKEATRKAAKPAPIVVRASSRYVRVAPRKARLVADQVRGLQIDRARALLQFSPRGAARDIVKLIESAASNAENNHELVADEMRVAEITVDEGPTLRRFRPRALGRATPINKRTSHIAVALSPQEEA